MTIKQKAWLNFILLLATLGVNFAGGTGLINNMSQKEVSDRYSTLITPASMTFSIWSVIYILLVVSMIVMIVKHRDEYYARAIEEISMPFWLTCVLNMLWIVTFSYLQLGISTIFIFAFVLTLAFICRKLLAINHQEKRWLLPLTFGLYTGWLFIATVVNVAAYLVQMEWNGFGISASNWAIIILIVSVVLILIVLTQLKNAVFPIPVAWAYWGIYQQLHSSEGQGGAYPALEMIAIVGMVVLVAVAVYLLYRNQFTVLPSERNGREHRFS